MTEKKGIKILFIYPNTFGMNMLPPAIALFSAIQAEAVFHLNWQSRSRPLPPIKAFRLG